jgi:hypothetical protein
MTPEHLQQLDILTAIFCVIAITMQPVPGEEVDTSH